MEAFLNIVNKTYVINMDKDVDRLRKFDVMMKKSNWEYTRFPAVNMNDNKSSVQKLKKKYIKDGYPLDMKLSEQGCLLSHVLLWKELVSNDSLDRILIFEDDAITYTDGKTIRNFIVDFYNNTPEIPDVLYLGKCLDQCYSYEHIWGNVYKSQGPLCTHAYIINKDYAQYLLQFFNHRSAIDMFLSKSKGSLMVFHPSIYQQDIMNGESNLRSKVETFKITHECLSPTHTYPSINTWNLYLTILGIISVVIVGCFIYYLYTR